VALVLSKSILEMGAIETMAEVLIMDSFAWLPVRDDLIRQEQARVFLYRCSAKVGET
jgi:hypothetical protein